MEKWITKNKKQVFHKRIFTLNDLECYHPGKSVSHNFFILDTNDWINVVALTEEGHFIMVKQHRLGTDSITIETPGGVIESDESAQNTALRELLEETGYEPEEIFLLKKLSANPAIMNNYIHFYFASGCKKKSEQNLDHAEDIDIVTFPADEIISMIKKGSIEHSIVITALSLYFMSEHCDYPVKL
ncbi:MAG: NUDIX hydrolase [bacterium]|nr:NUDIX hydrolase [bacterium]